MDFKANYTIVGIFVVLLGAALIAIFFWLSIIRQDKTYNTYLVYMSESVTGLSIQSPVRYNGVQVGYVDDIKLDPSNPQLVQLTLKIQEGTPITTSTVATLVEQGVTGVVFVGLKTKTVDAPKLVAKPGEKYPVIAQQASFLMQLSEVLPQITKNVNDLGSSFRKVFDAQNRQAIKNILKNMDTFTHTLANNSKELDASMKSMQKILKNSSAASKQLPQVMDELKATLNTVNTSAKQIGEASKAVHGTMQHSQVALNNFSNQVLPSASQAMSRLNQMTANLQTLTSELARNPSVLVRGRQPEPPGPGEK